MQPSRNNREPDGCPRFAQAYLGRIRRGVAPQTLLLYRPAEVNVSIRRQPDQATVRLLLAVAAICAQTASVTCSVVAVPPRSRVCSEGFAVTCSIAFITRPAASISPRCSSSITTDQKVPTGLAHPLPMMSKADPWIGSNIDR